MKPAQAKRLTAAIRQQLKRDRADLVGFASAVRALAAIGFEPRGRLISIRFPTKRRPDPIGTVGLAATGLLERDSIGMLTMEPTSAVVWNANRGVLSVRVEVLGKPAHVGLQFRAINAFRGNSRSPRCSPRHREVDLLSDVIREVARALVDAVRPG